jgi:hypothetical protein
MFKRGESGNPEGRPKGAKDKAQADIKQAYQSLIEGNLSNIEKWLNEVATKDPGRAIDLMLRLSDFILPKLKAVELKTDFAEPLHQIIVVNDQETKDTMDKLKKQLNNN